MKDILVINIEQALTYEQGIIMREAYQSQFPQYDILLIDNIAAKCYIIPAPIKPEPPTQIRYNGDDMDEDEIKAASERMDKEMGIGRERTWMQHEIESAMQKAASNTLIMHASGSFTPKALQTMLRQLDKELGIDNT